MTGEVNYESSHEIVTIIYVEIAEITAIVENSDNERAFLSLLSAHAYNRIRREN